MKRSLIRKEMEEREKEWDKKLKEFREKPPNPFFEDLASRVFDHCMESVKDLKWKTKKN